MANTLTHKIFHINEILEAILLQTDTCTLLTSAQRVCHQWRNLIQDSDDLQVALFFKPSKKKAEWGCRRMRNPLIEAKIWPQLFRKRLHLHTGIYSHEQFPWIDPNKEEAYLRNNASWRRMLFQQPATSRIGVIETMAGPTTVYSVFHLKTKTDDGFLRLGHIFNVTRVRALTAGQDPLVFWQHSNLPRHEREQQAERSLARTTYLNDCDVVIFLITSIYLSGFRPSSNFDRWLESTGHIKRYPGYYKRPIWDDETYYDFD